MAKEVKQQEFAEVTIDTLKANFKNLSDEDIAFLTNTEKILKDSDVIGIHKYITLKNQEQSNNTFNQAHPDLPPRKLTELEQKQIVLYETDKLIRDQETLTKEHNYTKGVRSDEPKKIEKVPGVAINIRTLYMGFKHVFRLHTGKEFVENEETIPNIEAVVKYFAQDETFFKCKQLVTDVDGVALEPTFGKGILLLGHFGNGKSTILKCFEILINHNYNIAYAEKWDNFKDWEYLRFKMVNCHDLVSEYEGLTSQYEKDQFIKKYGGHQYTDNKKFNRISGAKYALDDLKKEPEASNYGKKELLRGVLEKRYDNKRRTHGTCNYHKDHPGNVGKALMEFGTKYGGHVYDRIFLMFNIIHFTGKSFRK